MVLSQLGSCMPQFFRFGTSQLLGSGLRSQISIPPPIVGSRLTCGLPPPVMGELMQPNMQPKTLPSCFLRLAPAPPPIKPF